MKTEEPWYKKGLHFNCTQCGACCTGSPGYVWIDEKEIEAMAKFLKISDEEFVKRYTRKVQGRLSLIEHPKTFDCVFLKERKCLLYNARPRQCKTFPWWSENLASKEAWEETAKRCEGINQPDAPLINFGEIEKQRTFTDGD
ncbi:MAG: YkgJ family cysteine cluster protein [Chlamydiales bacterium]